MCDSDLFPAFQRITQPPGIWETLTLLAGGGLRAAGASKKKKKYFEMKNIQ